MMRMYEGKYENMETNYEKLHWIVGNIYITTTLYYSLVFYIGGLI